MIVFLKNRKKNIIRKYKNMVIIYNNVIPVKGFSAMNLFGLIFARKAFKPLPKLVINHESIHTK